MPGTQEVSGLDQKQKAETDHLLFNLSDSPCLLTMDQWNMIKSKELE